jgi:hypothetical protein
MTRTALLIPLGDSLHFMQLRSSGPNMGRGLINTILEEGRSVVLIAAWLHVQQTTNYDCDIVVYTYSWFT